MLIKIENLFIYYVYIYLFNVRVNNMAEHVNDPAAHDPAVHDLAALAVHDPTVHDPAVHDPAALAVHDPAALAVHDPAAPVVHVPTVHDPSVPAPHPPVPSQRTYDTWDLNRDKENGTPIHCSQCGEACTSKKMYTTENGNPCHTGSSVKYVIVFCSGQCHQLFFEQCNDALPFRIARNIIFTFNQNKDGGPEGYWRTYSNIPEDGGWIIFKSTDEGHTILDEKDRPIWMRIDDSTLRQACRV